jgi:hypothetical protein
MEADRPQAISGARAFQVGDPWPTWPAGAPTPATERLPVGLPLPCLAGVSWHCDDSTTPIQPEEEVAMRQRTRFRKLPFASLLGGLMLVSLSLPGAASAATSPSPTLSKTGSAPVSAKSIGSCRTYLYWSNSAAQVAAVDACLERLPGGVRAHFYFSVSQGTANFKGTLNTCSIAFGCRKSRAFQLQGVGSTPVGVATDWDSACPTVADWYGYLRLLDIRFLPSGELHQGTGPYLSQTLRTTAC